MGRYLKQKMADLLLCSAVSVSLIPVICSGFVLTDPWSQSLAVILVCSLLLQLLFTLLARRRATIWLGIGAGMALAAAVFAHMRMTNPLSDEVSNSVFIFVLIQILTPLLVFLLSQSRAGVIALFLIGDLICAGCHFLQYPAPDWCLFLFLAGTAVLFFCRVCAVSAEKAELGRVSAPQYLRQTLVLCAVGLAAAVGIYAAVIVPLDPPTQELKLITQLRSMELMQVLGVSTTEVILDPDLTADVPPEEIELSDQRGDDESDAMDGQDELQPDETQDSETIRENITTTLQQAAAAIRYDSDSVSWLWLLLLPPAAIVAAYALRYWLKRRWRRRVRALSRESAVLNYYGFFLSCFRRMGLKRQPGQTLREFAGYSAAQTEPFEECGIPFRELTEIYEKVLYGRHQVTQREYDRFERFYDTFHRSLRREVGTLKYYVKAFLY